MENILNVHNKFEVKVYDASTGKLKNEAVGYNAIMLETFFNEIYVYNEYFNENSNNAKIYFSSGNPDTNIAISEYDISIPGFIGYKGGSDAHLLLKERVFSSNISSPSHVTYYCILGSSEYNDTTIKEVGLVGDSGSSSEWSKPMTKALLKDINGNPHPITKTSSDIIYIYATIYAVMDTTTNNTTDIISNDPKENFIISNILGKVYNTKSYNFYASSIKKSNSNTYYGSYYLKSSRSNQVVRTFNEQITFNLPLTESNYLNNTIVRSIFTSCGGTTFPNSTLFPATQITGETIGTGDGTTTEFKVKVPEFKSGSLVVYKNGSALVEGTDYTSDNTANSNGLYGYFPSLDLTWAKTPSVVKIGNAIDYADETNLTSSRYDPFTFHPYGTNQFASEFRGPNNSTCTFNSSNPIWLDFGSAKECNTLRYIAGSGKSSYVLVLEYSNDNSTWTSLTTSSATTPDYTFTFAKTSARYWRFYFNNINESFEFNRQASYYLSSGTLFDGKHISFFPRFLLGKIAPAIVFNTAPAVGDVITADYKVEVPFKTDHNNISYSQTIKMARYSNPPSPVDLGGRIVYIDNTATGASYIFYDKQGNVMQNVQIGDRPASVTITGTPDKDKYYIYGDPYFHTGTYFVPKFDSESNGTLYGTSTDFGTGKSNTTLILNTLSPVPSTNLYRSGSFIRVVYSIRNIRPYRGYSDWYIPSKDEASLFFNSKDSDNNYIIPRVNRGWDDFMTSSEYDATNQWTMYENGDPLGVRYNSKTGTTKYILIRSF